MLNQAKPLAVADAQLRILRQSGHKPFSAALQQSKRAPLTARGVEILQVNLGKLCNMTCAHCHVDAGPDRREIMSHETVQACLNVLQKHHNLRTLDLTGGAPEMNPHFREFIGQARQLECHIIDRCNLTILLAPGFRDMPQFLADHEVEIVASLPCYLEQNTDSQRGDGAYVKSIEALKQLNNLGYGQPNSPLVLTLVYNPIGPNLPANQAELESAYRRELSERFGIQFTRLFTITNMPISRFLDHLVEVGEYEQYMEMLISAFNPAAIDGLMCRNTISVGWDGTLYDCDFNQMLEIGIAEAPHHIEAFDFTRLSKRPIVTDQHCYGCTAGAGSGCQGAID